jgi:hypothetical protein
MKKTIIKLLVLLFIITSIAGCSFYRLSDLRVDNYQFPNDQEKAQQLMQEMGVAHNIQLWDSIQTYSVTYGDEFYGFFGKQAHPFSEQNMTFTLTYIPKDFNGQMEIMNGENKGDIWGMQSWKVYKKDSNGTAVLQDNKDMKFWIPTYQYFIELANRIQEASVIDYVGTKTIDGIRSEGILASWNTIEPQKDIDQYLVWIDADTKRIVKVEYTVRDAYRFVTGAAHFQDYRDYDGILLPSVLPVESNLLRKGILHKMTINDFVADPVKPDAILPLNQ